MNIENHFTNAQAYLEMASLKFDNLDYDSTLAALSKAYSNIRKAMDQVLEMKHEAKQAASPAGDDSGGPEQ